MLTTSDDAALVTSLKSRDRNLWVASHALPPEVRRPWLSFLAFRRAVRDAVIAEARGSLDDLGERVSDAFDGHAGEAPLDRAIAWLASDHELPRACFEGQLEAASWDLDGRRHHTLSRVVDYAVRRMGTVAVAAACTMGRRGREPIERAVDLGVAIELTRIARDVGRDATHGHVYLPVEWLEEAGVDVDRWLARPGPSDALARVAARLGSEAERFYLRADAGMQLVPLSCRPAVRASRWLGKATLRELASTGFAAATAPSRLAAPRVLAIGLRALYAARGEHTDRAPSPLEEARWLVDAASR